MRKLLVTLSLVAVIGGGTAVDIGAQTAPPKVTPEQAAQKLLQTKASRFMTAPALAAMHMLATGSRNFGEDGAPSGLKFAHAGSGSHRGTSPSAPGLGNVRVNDPGEDTHQPSQTTQSETSLAVSGNNIAVGFNDSQSTLLFLTPGTNLSGIAYSRNGGQTFTDGGVIPNASGGTINFGDPWLASDSAGSMYYSTLVDDPSAGLLVGVAKSTNGGQTWTPPTVISPPTPANSNGFFLGADKDSLFSSTSGLSDTWDDFTATFDPSTGAITEFSGLTLAQSSDGGQTWSSKYVSQIPIGTFNPSGPSDCSFHQYIGAQSIVGPDGTLYVASLRFDANDPTCSGAPVTESEYIFASHDGGATFGPGVKIADVTPSTGPNGAFVLGPAEYMRNIEFPTFAFRGTTLYATWNDGGDGSGHSHIRLARSSDGAASWTTSWVTSGSNDEAQPAISSDASGLHIAYYEISGAGGANALLDVFTANSTDGTTFTSTRVTNQSFPGVLSLPNFDPIIAQGYMGDYITDVSDGTHQYIAWGDNRNVVTDFLYPQGRNDPDVYFAKQ